MSAHYDEKGKYFSPVVTKKPVEVIIQTVIHRITGNIHVHLDERIIDELDRNEPFLAVTDAKIFGANGEQLYAAAFITINRQQIIWLMPIAEMTQTSE